MGNTAGECPRQRTPKRSAGRPKRLDESFELEDLKNIARQPKVARSMEKTPTMSVSAPLKLPSPLPSPGISAAPSPLPSPSPSRPKKRMRTSPSHKHSILFESSWPRTSEELWNWEPIRNFFVTLTDRAMKLLDNPIVHAVPNCEHAKELYTVLPGGDEPIGVHYAAQWLKEDAQEVVGSRREQYAVCLGGDREVGLLGNYRYCLRKLEVALGETSGCSKCKPVELRSVTDWGTNSFDDNGSSVRSLSIRSNERDVECKKGSDPGKGTPDSGDRVGQVMTRSPNSLLENHASPISTRSPTYFDDGMGAGIVSRSSQPSDAPSPQLCLQLKPLGGLMTTASEKVLEGSPSVSPHDPPPREMPFMDGLERSPARLYPITIEFKTVDGSISVVSHYRMPLRCTSTRSENGLKAEEEASAFEAMRGCLHDMERYEINLNLADADENASDELSTEICRLREELDTCVKRNASVRAEILPKARAEIEAQRRIDSLIAEEKDIINRLRKIKRNKSRAEKRKDSVGPRTNSSPLEGKGRLAHAQHPPPVEASGKKDQDVKRKVARNAHTNENRVKSHAKHGEGVAPGVPKPQASNSTSNSRETAPPTPSSKLYKEMTELKNVRGELERFREAAELCKERESYRRIATDDHFTRLKTQLALARNKKIKSTRTTRPQTRALTSSATQQQP